MLTSAQHVATYLLLQNSGYDLQRLRNLIGQVSYSTDNSKMAVSPGPFFVGEGMWCAKLLLALFQRRL